MFRGGGTRSSIMGLLVWNYLLGFQRETRKESGVQRRKLVLEIHGEWL